MAWGGTNQWALLEGDERTGVGVMAMEEVGHWTCADRASD